MPRRAGGWAADIDPTGGAGCSSACASAQDQIVPKNTDGTLVFYPSSNAYFTQNQDPIATNIHPVIVRAHHSVLAIAL